MGFFDWFRRTPMYEGEPALFVSDIAYARTLVVPPEPALESSPPPVCEGCDRAMEERLFTTRGGSLDPAIWDAAPVAVDAWLCVGCGVARYPRPVSAETITAFGARAAELARQGHFADAEWWLVRMVWAWPHYSPGWLDLAQARVCRAETEAAHDPPARQRAHRRAVEAYETAVSLETAQPTPLAPRLIPAALLGLAEIALHQRAPARAERALAACLARDDLDRDTRERAQHLQRYVAERRWVFADASAVISGHIDLQDRRGAAIDEPGVRKRVAQAVEALEALYDDVPSHWQSIWVAAKGRAALGEAHRAIALWRRAWRDHPHEADVVREHGLALLRLGLHDEARAVSRDATERMPRDATLWCNRAVTEVLSGDLAEARRCARISCELAPADPIARGLAHRLAALDEGALPRTLAELERRS